MTHWTAIACLAAVAALAPASTGAQTPAPPIPAAYGAPIGLTQAQALVERGVALAREQGLVMAVAVVEPTGELVAFARMDDAAYGTVGLAQAKARTAARFRVTTAAQEERVRSGRTDLLTADDFVTIGGGVPIVVNGRVIGAVGVSGGSSAQDAAIAAAVATATVTP